MYLSKSIYVDVWGCPKKAWIKRYHPEWVEISEAQQARFDTGNEVGDLARGLFGPYVDVTAYKEDGSLNKAQMIRNTADEMARGTSVICEAAFSYEGLYCAVDLLRRDDENGGWAIYEVKSSKQIRDYYIADVSYQKYVLEHCGVKVTGVYLVNIDGSYVLGPEGLDPAGFFRINDLWEEASRAQLDTVPGVLVTTGKTLALTRWTFVSKVTSLLFNMLSRLVIACLPRSKRLFISWLQSPSAVVWELKKIVSHCLHCFPIYLP